MHECNRASSAFWAATFLGLRPGQRVATRSFKPCRVMSPHNPYVNIYMMSSYV